MAKFIEASFDERLEERNLEISQLEYLDLVTVLDS